MSQEARARKIYERRVLEDAVSRLAKIIELGSLPFSEAELHTFHKRMRAAIFGSPRAKVRLVRYKAHLATIYDSPSVERLARHLEEINNQIAWEEK